MQDSDRGLSMGDFGGPVVDLGFPEDLGGEFQEQAFFEAGGPEGLDEGGRSGSDLADGMEDLFFPKGRVGSRRERVRKVR